MRPKRITNFYQSHLQHFIISFSNNHFVQPLVEKPQEVMMNIKDIRETNHYIVFRIGADTDIKNGRVKMVEKALKSLEAKEDYVACQALSDALKYQFQEVECN